MPETAEVVQISAAQLAELQGAAAKLQSLESTRAAEVQAAETRAMLARGEVNAVTQRHQSELQAVRDQTKQLVARNALAGALAKHQLSLGSPEQLAVIWAKDVEVDESGGNFTARTRDYQPVDKWVSDQLAKPINSHFLATGHSSAPGAGRPGHQGQQAPAGLPFENPTDAGRALINKTVQQRLDHVAAVGGRSAGLDMSQQFGLTAPRR